MQFVHARFGYGPRLFEKSRIADSEFVAKTRFASALKALAAANTFRSRSISERPRWAIGS
jgi:hypothetical protein